MDSCIFCKIAKREIPSNIIYESDSVMAFPDINPLADLHIIIAPKQHIGAIGDIQPKHGALLIEIYSAVNKLVVENNLQEDSYRIVVNGGKAQHVPHLHFHLLGGQWKRQV